MIQVKPVKVADLIPYANNARTHSDEQVAQIAASIKEFGWTNPILVDGENGIIAGHGRLAAARKLGMDEVPAIQLDGLSKAQKKALILADNKLALNSGWDEKLLEIELLELQEMNYDLSLTGFNNEELKDIFGVVIDPEQNPYSQKVTSPLYEPKGEKPSISELYDDEKTMGLIEDIKNSNLPDQEKQFLMTAASRHIVFNYQSIAEYYAHATPDCQRLMEDSALIIVDFDKAIADGYVKLNKKLSEIFDLEDDDE